CAVFAIDAAASPWYDTLPLARSLLTPGSYSLPFVARALNLDDLTHHEAQGDAIQAARFPIALSGRAGAGNLRDLSLPLGRASSVSSSSSISASGDGSRPEGDFSSLTATDVLAGHSVVFTGKLDRKSTRLNSSHVS